MKQCPVCHTTYADDLRFCLNDGNSLVPVIGDGEETVISSQGGAHGNAIRIDTSPELAQQGEPTVAFGAPRQTNQPQQPNYAYQGAPGSAPPPKKRGSSFAIIAIALVLLLLVAGGGLLVAASLWMNSRGNANNSQVASTSPTPTATPIATPSASPSPKKSATPEKEDDGTEEIRDALAQLQKMLEEEQKKSGSSPGTPSGDGTDHDDSQLGTMAFANSPENGFLALRSEPSSDSGTRITKIPHGAKMTINKCGKTVTTKRGNRGRWCTAGHAGKIGWVFDKYVTY